MIDVKFILDNDGRFDIDIENGDLVGEDGFDTAIWISLFTDARASSSQVLQPEQRRGWIGNKVSIDQNRQLGGYLWLIDQRRLNHTTLIETIDYARKSLQWLIDDNICTAIDVSGIIKATEGIELTILITSTEGITTTNYVKIWKKTG